MLTLHGRTRSDGFSGNAEYDSIAEVKSLIDIPIVANGDINSPQKAKFVLSYTGADAIMIGRAAKGNPWIFREIDFFLKYGKHLPKPYIDEVRMLMQKHLDAHYSFYGQELGVKTARKHIGWYVKNLFGGELFRSKMNLIENCSEQLKVVDAFFEKQKIFGNRLRYIC
tara:strand:+ start:285 stop:788 length:504 start_codon:yes stop_codon:yes gene_type:complete